MTDEHRIKEALAARSEAPSDAFRRSISAALAGERPVRSAQPWLVAVAGLLLLVLPVAILLASRAGLNRPSNHPPSTATETRLLPPAGANLPVTVTVAPDGTAWAVLQGASYPSELAVATSGDAGTHWQSVLGLPAGQVVYLAAFDGKHAVLVWTETLANKFASPPTAAKIYSTADGGRTWRSYTLPSMADGRYRFSFVSTNEGWWLPSKTAGAAPTGAVMHTTDGGKSWEQVASDSDLVSVSFIDSKTGFIGVGLTNPSAPPQMRRTTDGGKTWKAVQLPSPPAAAGYPGNLSTTEVHRSAGSRLIATLTSFTGSMGVGAPESLVIYTSLDNGASWSPGVLAWTGKTAEAGSPVFTVTFDNTWFIAVGRQILRTTDGGASWRAQSVAAPTSYQATQLIFGPSSTGVLLEQPFACQGCRPMLFRTTDGGSTWVDASVTGQTKVAPETRVSLGGGIYEGDPAAPALLLRLGNDHQLRAVSWDLSQSGITGAAGTSIFQSADGLYYFDADHIYDRSGRQLGAFPWTTKGFDASWSTGDQLCRASGSTPATGSPLVLQIAAIGKTPRTVATGFGTYGDNSSYPVLACDETSDLAVVAALGQGIAPFRVWVIQLSSGRILKTFTYSGGPPGVAGVRASADGTLLAESSRSTSGSWTTTIRHTSDGSAVEALDNLDVHAFSGDSKMLAGVRGTTPVVIERGTQREIWSAPGKGWYGAFAEPRGARFLIATAADPSSLPSDVYVVSPNGSAALMPEGVMATLLY
jgi:photosystem II stability/assembly factor-like uncharacterized protein